MGDALDTVVPDDRDDPHFLHERSHLEPVIQPPHDDVRAIAWWPKKEALALCDGDGGLHLFDPIFGTRTLATDLCEPANAVAISPNGAAVALVIPGRALELRASSGALLSRSELDVVGGLWVGICRQGVAVTGRTLTGRKLYLFNRRGVRTAQGELPDGVVAGVGADGRLKLGRVRTDGPEVVDLGQPLAPAKHTTHKLRFSEEATLYGLAAGGLTIWPGPAQASRTIRKLNPTAAAIARGDRWAAIGDRKGALALLPLVPETKGAAGHRGAHDSAIKCLAFSRRGRWLASLADDCWLWRYAG